ncbi:hypothetical protein EFE42_01220 [Methanohalophilus sp. RSK]|uniref:hypothetical protein n=1 Tax=Methanohalophilus sp. RSK TaxID=2485783 RepID=UPI000F43D017|nr:hypothetical protein [Methanohalophilus sp. RSK]RNI15888.1 hypothetical protein EFE42_01220 [Methanohalophilus sp. RSK]
MSKYSIVDFFNDLGAMALYIMMAVYFISAFYDYIFDPYIDYVNTGHLAMAMILFICLQLEIIASRLRELKTDSLNDSDSDK